MGQIQIKYEEVYKRTTALKSHINNDLLKMIDNEYNYIQGMLDKVDSGTNSSLKETMESNRQKSIMVAKTLDKLLSFMANSSKQVQLNEQKMATAITSGGTNAEGGNK